MWCPEGYISWYEMFTEVMEVADEIAALASSGGLPAADAIGANTFISTGRFSLLNGKIVDTHYEADLAVNLFSAWLLTHFIETFPPVAADTKGNIVSLNPLLFCHRDQFEYCGLGWPMTRTTEFSSYLTHGRRDEDGGTFSLIFDRFCFIDVITGSILPRNGTREHLLNVEGYSASQASRILESAASLRDFRLCWKRLPDREDWLEFLEVVEIDERFKRATASIFRGDCAISNDQEIAEFDDTAIGGRRGGRPRKRDRAALAYRELFPEGHGSRSWKEVLRQIERTRGIRTNITSIRRGLLDLQQNPDQN